MWSLVCEAQDQSADSNIVELELNAPWDWLQLSSGEWIKGEIQRMEDFTVYFDSDKLDDLQIEWEDVQAIRTTRPMAVLLRNADTAVGALRTRDGELYIPSQNMSIDFYDVINITTGSSRRLDQWSGTIAASTNIRKGNVDQEDVNVSVNFLRRNIKTDVRVSYLGNFSETDGEENANEHRANLSYDYRLSTKWFWRPLSAEYYRDPFQNIQAQWTLGTGGGYYLVQNYELTWLVAAGPAYQSTDYTTVAAGSEDPVSSAALFISTQYDQEVTGDIDLSLSYQLTLMDEDAGRAKHHATLSLSVDITDALDLTVGAYWDRIANPQPDEEGIVPKKDDYRLAVGLSYEL